MSALPFSPAGILYAMVIDTISHDIAYDMCHVLYMSL